MKNHFKTIFAITVFTALLTACGGGGDKATTRTSSDYQFICSSTAGFTPSAEYANYPSTAATPATTTVIVLHGKSGSPLASHLTPLYSDLQAAGYDVKAPYMPWGNNGNFTALWTGTLCQAMQYIDDLISAEKMDGKKVVLIGHSMGGAGTLIYNSTAGVSDADASISIAPGHFMHRSYTLQTQTASSVSAAQSMVTAGNGDTNAAFQTYNNGALQDVTTTANIFLSYHDLDQYPDIVNDVLSAQQGPLFWIGGSTDSLTTTYNYPSLFNTLPDNADSQYQTITGNHLSVVAKASSQIISWIGGLGL